jgi:hypothetical protein
MAKEETRKKVKAFDIALLLCCGMLLLTFVYTGMHGQKVVSEAEQRNLEKYPPFSLSSYIDGDFQDKLEGSLADQFYASGKIKVTTIGFRNKVYKAFTQDYYRNKVKDDIAKKPVKPTEEDTEISEPVKPPFVYVDRYRKVSAKYFVWGEGKQLMRPSRGYLQPEYSGNYKAVLDALNSKVPEGLDKYLFLVETPEILDFNAEKNEHLMRAQLQEYLPEYNVDSLEVANYETYDLYFFDTDHHMNSIGARQAYQQIISMVFGEDEPLIQPTEYKNFGVNYYGSLATGDAYRDIKEDFSAYIYDYPTHKTYLGGTFADGYGLQNSYLRGKISTNEFANHYRNFFGGDWPEVHFDYSETNATRPDKKNVLIISDSIDNSLTPLLATHFNQTYTVDLRHYKDFNIADFCKKNEINTFIYIGSVATLTGKAWILK